MGNWSLRKKWIVGAAGSLLLMLGLLFYTPPGLVLAGRIVGPLTGGTVRIQNLSGLFPNHLRASSIEIADAQGVWLRLREVSLDWSALSALGHHIRIQDMTASEIAVLRRPVPSESGQSETPRLDVAHFQFPRIDIGEAVIGRRASLGVAGSFDYASLHQIKADITAARRDNSDSYRIEGAIAQDIAQGGIQISEGDDGILADLAGLPGLGPVNLEARATGGSDANLLSISLSAGALRASGNGMLQLARQQADVNFQAMAPEMRLRPGLGWQALTATGRFQGSFTAPQILAQLRIEGAIFDDIKASTIALDMTGSAGRATLQAEVAGVMLPGAGADLFAHAPVEVEANADLAAPARPVTFTVRHPLAQLRGQADTRGPTRATAQLDIPSLAPFAAQQGIDMRGSAGLHVIANQSGARTRLTLQGRMDTEGSAILARLLGTGATLDFDTVLEGSDVVESHVRLRGAAIATEGRGTVRKGVLAYAMTLNISDLARLADTLQGSLDISGTANGPLATAALRAHGSAQVASTGFKPQRVAIEVEASGLPAPQTGRLTMSGRLNNAPLSVQARLSGEKSRQVALNAQWKSVHATADIALPEDAPVSGKVELAVRQLADIAAFTGTQMTGAADATVLLAVNRGKTDARLTADLHDLEQGAARIASAELRGQIGDVFGARGFDVTATAQGVSAAGFAGDATLDLSGPQDRLAAQLRGDLKDASGAPATLTADALLEAQARKITLQSLSAAWRGTELALRAPAIFDYADGLAVSQMSARLGAGEINASGRLLPALDFSAAAQNISLDDLRSFLPGGLAQGTLSATAQLRGTLSAPQGVILLKGRDLRAAFSSRSVPPASAEARAEFHGDRADVTATLQAGTATNLSVAGDIGLTADQSLRLQTKGDLDLTLLDPLLAADGRRIRGRLAFQADVAGTLSAPLVSGNGTLSDGAFQDYLRGIQVQAITATLAGRGTDVRITQFQGRAGNGTVTGTGALDLAAPGLPVTITLEANNARPITSDLFTATLSGTVKLTGTLLDQLAVSGDIRVLRGEINLPDRFPPEVAVLNVRRKGQAPAPPRPAASRVSLDVAMRSAGPIFVRGHGIDAEMGGEIRIRGTSAVPIITGGFQMNRGSYNVAGQRLEFTTGRIGFDGTGLRNRLDPTLDFVAQTVSGGITAVLRVTGYASAPKIALSSTPSLPQDEIIAQLLFRQSVKQLTPLQLASIAQAVAAFGGMGGGLNPLGTVRSTLGLDRLSVGSTSAGATDEQSHTTVEAGRYVSPNVYVGVKQTLSGGTQTQVQVDITRRLKAQATLSTGTDAATTRRPGEDTGSSIGLSYQFEY